jgi:MFS family permease
VIFVFFCKKIKNPLFKYCQFIFSFYTAPKIKQQEMRLFYGWWLTIGLMLMYTATNGIAMYAFGILRKMQEQQAPFFGLNPQTQAAVPSFLFLAVAFVSPFVGAMLDRYNTKRLIAIGAVAVVILTYLQQFMTSYGGLVFIYVAFAMAMTLTGIVSFMFLLRRWFRKNIGLASGIMLLGSSLGGIIFPKIMSSTADWQLACTYLAVSGAFFLLLPILLLKNHPSEMGLFPDGQTSTMTEGSVLAESLDNNVAQKNDLVIGRGEGVTLKEALRTPTFYLVLVTTCVLWFCINGYMQNHNFYIADLFASDEAGKQAAKSMATKLLSTFGMMAIIGKVLFGWLSDRYSHKFIMMGSISMMLVSVICLKMSQQSMDLLVPFALIFGIGFGGAFTIIQVWVADIYVGRSYGSILGVVTMVDTLAGSLGMILLGSQRKATGSYDSGFNVLIGLCVLAIVCTFFVKKPTATTT